MRTVKVKREAMEKNMKSVVSVLNGMSKNDYFLNDSYFFVFSVFYFPSSERANTVFSHLVIYVAATVQRD